MKTEQLQMTAIQYMYLTTAITLGRLWADPVLACEMCVCVCVHLEQHSSSPWGDMSHLWPLTPKWTNYVWAGSETEVTTEHQRWSEAGQKQLHKEKLFLREANLQLLLLFHTHTIYLSSSCLTVESLWSNNLWHQIERHLFICCS